MKFIIKNYYLESNKIKKSVKIFHFTDLHYSIYSSNEKLLKLNEEIVKNNPDYVVFTGDLIDSNLRYNYKIEKELLDFFNCISSKYKIIFIKGNHDLIRSDAFGGIDTASLYNTLSHMKNVYYLDGFKNKVVRFENVDFYGFELGLEHYYIYKEKDSKDFDSMFNQVSKEFDKDKYSVFLFHSPIILFSTKKLKEKLDLFDLTLVGHMHNGLIPSFFDNKKSSWGLITPRRKLFPRNSRNIIKLNDSYMVIGYPTTFYYLFDKYKINNVYKPGYQIINID